MHRILKLELELEQTNNDCAMCIVQYCNEITITIINMGRKFRGLGPHLTQSPLS